MELPEHMEYSGWRVKILRRGHFPDTVIVLLNGAEIEVLMKELSNVNTQRPIQQHQDSTESPKT